MRVLHVGPKNYPPSHGGTERVVYNLVKGSAEIDSHILVEFRQEERRNIKVLPGGYFEKIKFIVKYVRNHEIDIVHFHNETYIPLALIYSLFNRKNLLTVHGCHFTNPKYNWFQRISIFIFDILGAIMLPRLIFCNEVDKNKFSKWIPFRKIYFVPNGVDIPSFSAESKGNTVDKMVYLGRISPEKNLLSLIKAAEQSKKSLHIYGAFDERRPEFNTSIRMALEKSKYVEYKGAVAYSQVFSTLTKYKCFVYPSLSEGLPLSVLEAASCGLSLILSDIPQHRILNFPIVKYINPKSFSLDNLGVEKDGRVNSLHVSQNFSIQNMTGSYKNIYKSFR